MSTLVVGDVHGCADELDALVRLVDAERVILVGDLFTKGPDPGGVWALIGEHGFESVMGNHEANLLRALTLKKKERRATEHGCIRRLNKAGRSWKNWVGELPLFIDVGKWTVVHAGLHPTKGKKGTTRRMALRMRRWPDDDPDNPYWHQLYEGKRRVVFGHDAIRGLVRIERKGKPHCVGLDSGCVYGGSLSGYVIEEDSLVQVEARRSYQAV